MKTISRRKLYDGLPFDCTALYYFFILLCPHILKNSMFITLLLISFGILCSLQYICPTLLCDHDVVMTFCSIGCKLLMSLPHYVLPSRVEGPKSLNGRCCPVLYIYQAIQPKMLLHALLCSFCNISRWASRTFGTHTKSSMNQSNCQNAQKNYN